MSKSVRAYISDNLPIHEDILAFDLDKVEVAPG